MILDYLSHVFSFTLLSRSSQYVAPREFEKNTFKTGFWGEECIMVRILSVQRFAIRSQANFMAGR